MQHQNTILHEYLRAKGLSQVEMARRAKVSQSTVSRALQQTAGRHSNARYRLFAYSGLREFVAAHPTNDGVGQVINAFNRIWDGSQAHAQSVVKIIQALD